jgi:hypothetical protein
MAKSKLLSVRIPVDLADQIDAKVIEGTTRTEVATELLKLGLEVLSEKELAAGFELLGEPGMQDMHFPTGSQVEAMKIAH